MESAALGELLVERLDASSLSADAQMYVYAAYQGSDELAEALEDVASARRPEAPTSAAADVPRTYLKSVAVRGFRGIGPEQALHLTPGPGLTLVVGRNGSGKSSFAEAAEVALTGANARWTGRLKVWREGWKNLHAGDDPRVSVELVVDGRPGVTRVARTWAGDDVEVSTATAQPHGEPQQPLDVLGLDEDLRTFRPFLSYAELGSMLLGKQSELHDALFSILGLETLAAAQQRLKAALKELDDRAKASSAEQRSLAAEVGQVPDDRARAVSTALTARRPDLAAVSAVLSPSSADSDDLSPLRAWAALPVPDAAVAAELADLLSASAERADSVAGTESGQARRLVALLEQALAHTEHSGSADCPVCGAPGRVDTSWRDATRQEIGRLRTAAAEADAAVAALRQARSTVTAVCWSAPAALHQVPAGVPGEGLAARWGAWAEQARSETVEDAVAALRATPELAVDVAAAVGAARVELSRREDLWRPISERVAAWLVGAREVADAAQVRTDLKAASEWLKGEADGLRNDRLAPVAQQAAQVWQQLRQESNVDLGPVRLAGTATQRRVTLDVTVDGVAGAALGVMSQGELHALALSLFLPRATLGDSPFRFLVIDDPVQAMDPAKVDGLARVLDAVARTHQVVVFTHDDRLPEAVRRLQLPATVWQVVRREGSIVELTKNLDPVARYLDDARALANSDELPPAVASRVVAALCRGAVEAACQETYRKKRLRDGSGHLEVEEALQSAQTTNHLAALALFEDARRGAQVLGRLNQLDRRAADAFQACRQGVHASYDGDLRELVTDTRLLTDRIRS